MLFDSTLDVPPLPSSDVFNYVFHYGRRPYPWSRVVYRVDGTDETLTLAQLEEKSRRFARAIKKKYGIQYPIAFFGALAAGATVALIPHQKDLSAEDVAGRLSQSKSKLLITDGALLHIAETASGLVGGVPIITLDNADNETANLQDLLSQALPSESTFELKSHKEAEEHDAFINRTSGSTGNMKSVLVSHSHYIATLEATWRTVPVSTDPERDVWLTSSSLGFLINAKLFMLLNILLGIPVVIMPEPLDEESISVIQRHQITFILVFPPLVAKLAKSNLNPKEVESIKWLLSAGATIPENLRQALATRFPKVDLTLEWGTSETMLIAIQTSDPVTRKAGSSGILVNENRLDNDEANREFDQDGFFHTGDYGYIDEERNVYIIDRLKELLRVGDGYGSRISASELENAVFEHPAVSTAVVVGIWDENTATQHPTAFVVPLKNYQDRVGRALAEDIEAFISTKLTGLRRLSGGVYFIDSYPTTGFKINRRALKALPRDEVSRVVGQSFHVFQPALHPQEHAHHGLLTTV
ncbi:hypothetical protein J3458_006967 [Metarhizium acridum]|uniref:uncharacterized protein n=1 Tax=Metarhizium acridum TaxID=92637 RepID=UPI001C6AE9D7|nr:hypothetical protein J3458_006967 [Metarhizium acridum]